MRTPLTRGLVVRWPIHDFLWATAIVALTTGLLLVIRATLGLEVANIPLGYLVAVLLVAVHYGLLPGVVASLLAFMAYNFLFVPPLHTFFVATPQDLFRLFVFLGVAVLTSSIAARARMQAQDAQHRARIQEALYQLSQAISVEVEASAILPTIAQQVVALLHVQGCRIQITGQGVRSSITESGTIGEDATAVVTPLQMHDRSVGMIQVWEAPDHPLDREARRLLDALAQQAALAVERSRLVDEATRLHLVAESDRLKSALLHSVSHDLRTPLVAIKGAVSNLLDPSVRWEAAAEQSFLETIDGEADRLNRLVRNLLDMSRIEAGATLPVRELASLDDVLGPVLDRLRRTLEHHPVELNLPPDLPLVPMAVLQIDQVLTNLLENAAKYAPPGSTITVTAALVGNALQVDVADRGPGIPLSERERIFDRFYRLETAESAGSGSGLGLSICRSWVEAHGGRIWVQPRSSGGAVFSFTLPRDAETDGLLIQPGPSATSDRSVQL